MQVMDGLFMTAASAILLLLAQTPLGQGEITTFGIWCSQAINTDHIANTVLVRRIHRNNAVGPQIHHVGRQQQLHFATVCQEFVEIEATHSARSQIVNTPMLA